MLFLLFQLGKEFYALEARQVHEVLPMVSMKEIPLAPRGVAGVFNYRGIPVPAIDLSELMLGHPASMLLSTRMILIKQTSETGEERLLGLIAERATETMRRNPGDFSHSGITSDAAPYLGPVTPDVRGFIQWVKVDQLLPETLRAALFKTPLENRT